MKHKKRTSSYIPDINLRDHETSANTRSCENPGCAQAGEHRAPKNRSCQDYFWFCLDHVKEYNARWDFYSGMSEDEIEAHRVRDYTWQRPSWPLGGGDRSVFIEANRRVHDPFSIFADHIRSTQTKQQTTYFPPHTEEAKALALLDLEWPTDIKTMKNKYKDLVKKYHPDRNPNDKNAEERLKIINHAYSVLKKLIQE